MANSKSRPRRPDVFEPALSNRPTGPRHGDSKVELVKQGVRGVLRSKNLRLLLDAAKAPEDLALLAELPLERLQNMASGALCSDETGYHLEQQLQLPSGWLDRNNTEVPSRFLALLANPNLSLEDLEAAHEGPATQEAVAKQETALVPVSTQSAPESVASAPAQESVATPAASAPAQEPAASVVATVVETPNEALQPTLEPVVEKALPTSENDEKAMTTPAELRLANLQVLLSGKGAKSALARLLQLSPASVTGMLNGVKPLDEELRLTITKVLQLGENWFDKERTEKDIPAAAQKLLSPLPRGATAPTPSSERQSSAKSKATADAGTSSGNATPDNGGAQGAATNGAGAEAGNASAGTDDKPASWPAGSKISKLRQITGEGAGTGAAASGTDAQAGGTSGATSSSEGAAAGGEGQPLASETNAPAAAPASTRRTATKANGATAGNQAASRNTPSAPAEQGNQLLSPATESRPIPVQQRGDAAPIVSAVLSDFVLPPIAEALIKTLALKATSGALTEDRAFELLGNVRGL